MDLFVQKIVMTLTLLIVTVQGCSDLPPGTRRNTYSINEQGVHYSEVILFGEVGHRVSGDFPYSDIDGVYTIQFVVRCIYKGEDIPKTIYVAGVGNSEAQIPGCPHAPLDHNDAAVLFLKRTSKPDVFVIEFRPAAGDVWILLDDLTLHCGLTLNDTYDTYFEEPVCYKFPLLTEEDGCIGWTPPVEPVTDTTTATTVTSTTITTTALPKIPLQFVEYVPVYLASSGSDLVIRCKATGFPVPEVAFWREGKVLDTAFSLDNTSNFKYLRLIGVKETANYTCIATSELNRIEQNILVYVKGLGTAPRNVKAKGLDSSTIYVVWEAPEQLYERLDESIHGYTVYYAIHSDLPIGTWMTNKVTRIGDKQTVLRHLYPDKTYIIRVQAFTKSVQGPLSEPLQVKTEKEVEMEILESRQREILGLLKIIREEIKSERRNTK